MKANSLADYGKKIEELGKLFQDPDAKLDDLVKAAYDAGLIIQFRVTPDPEQSIDIPYTKDRK